MGQCFGKEMIHLPSFKNWMSRSSSQHDVLRNTDEEDEHGITLDDREALAPDGKSNKCGRRVSHRKTKSLIRIFSLTKSRRKYDLQENDEVELPEIERKTELEDIEFDSNSESRVPPDVIQVAGLRNNPITCAFYSGKDKILRKSSFKRGYRNGNKFMILDPRGLGQETQSSSDDIDKDKGRHRSSNSSLDLEWEPEASMIPFVKKISQKSSPLSSKVYYSSTDNVSQMNNVESTASTIAPETRNSEVSSQNSIPGLDWDSQTENDLITANGLESLEMELETEQLISEIEQLTNRALQETNQWSSSLPSSPKTNDTQVFHKYQRTTSNQILCNEKSSLNNTQIILYEEANGNNAELLSNPGH